MRVRAIVESRAVQERRAGADTNTVIVETRPSPLRLAAAFPTKVGVRMWLGCLVVCSAAIRSIAAGSVRTPTYFPDEYIYSALSRSIAASGRPLVRGEPAHFPALLEPLLAAPLWLVGSIATGYRLVQCENALFMSLAAIPVYLLARRLGLSSRYALASAVFALALPELGFSALLLSDPLAYPLVLGALYAGVVALQAPSRRPQLSFVGLVGLATFARVEYVVLAVAFVIAAILLDGRSAARLQRLPFVLFGGVAIGVAALGPSRVLGFYSAVVRFHLDGSFLRWAALNLLFLALAGGVAIVPGAVVGLFRGGDRGARAFGALVVPFALAVMVETALYAGNGSDRFKERYLFMLLPLMPVSFGLYLRRGRPGRVAVALLATAIVAGSALLPLSGYVKGNGFDDSPFLWGYLELQWHLGVFEASLVVAALAAVGGGLALGTARARSLAWPALAWSLALALALSVGADRFERAVTEQSLDAFVGADPSWVDAAQAGPVSAIETDLAPAPALTEQLFWNNSIKHELLFGVDPSPTDPLATERLTVAANGDLFVSPGASAKQPNAFSPLRTAFLFQGFAVTARFGAAVRLGREGSFTLWRPTGIPRLRVYELGRYYDGWLNTRGGLEVWPAGSRAGTLSFSLSLPRSRPHAVTIRFGARSYRLTPGGRVTVRIPVAGSKPWSTTFAISAGKSVLADGRTVGLRSTIPTYTPA